MLMPRCLGASSDRVHRRLQLRLILRSTTHLLCPGRVELAAMGVALADRAIGSSVRSADSQKEPTMRTTRRMFIASSLGIFSLAPRGVVHAQETAKRITIGLLSPSPLMRAAAAFVDEMRTLGYVEGRNLAIDYRWAMSYERLPEAAAALG